MEKEKERERNIEERETGQLLPVHTPTGDQNCKPSYVP